MKRRIEVCIYIDEDVFYRIVDISEIVSNAREILKTRKLDNLLFPEIFNTLLSEASDLYINELKRHIEDILEKEIDEETWKKISTPP